MKYSKGSSMKIGGHQLEWASQFIIRNGGEINISCNVLPLKSVEAIETSNVKNMLVVTPSSMISTKADDRKSLKAKGSLGWIEILVENQEYYDGLRDYYVGGLISKTKEEQNSLPQFTINDPSGEIMVKLKN